MMGNNEEVNVIGAEVEANNKAARFDERLREQRAMNINYSDRNRVRQDTRTIANKLTQAGHKLMEVAFDLLQADADGVADITAIMVEIGGEDFKVRFIRDN